MKFAALGALLVMVLFAAACSATDVSSTSMANTTRSETTTFTTDGGSIRLVNNPQARTNFLAWWDYEVPTKQDAAKPVEEVYQHGLAACLWRRQGRGPDSVLTMIERDYGYTPAGATAVYKSALEALCTEYRGYKTYFDRNVDSYVAAISTKVTFPFTPTVFDYGYFMKEVCAAMGSTQSRPTIIAHMRQQTHLRLISGAPATSDEVMWDLVNQALLSGCLVLY